MDCSPYIPLPGTDEQGWLSSVCWGTKHMTVLQSQLVAQTIHKIKSTGESAFTATKPMTMNKLS